MQQAAEVVVVLLLQVGSKVVGGEVGEGWGAKRDESRGGGQGHAGHG